MIKIRAGSRIERGEGLAQTAAVEARRQANQRVRELADAVSVDGQPRREWWFFCECGDRECEEMVHLPPQVFDDIARRNNGRVLAAGHPLERARTARKRAGELRESASALRGQARQATRRASELRRTIRFRVELSEDDLLVS